MGQIESIELKDVSFSYDPAEKGRILLKKINIKFNIGIQIFYDDYNFNYVVNFLLKFESKF